MFPRVPDGLDARQVSPRLNMTSFLRCATGVDGRVRPLESGTSRDRVPLSPVEYLPAASSPRIRARPGWPGVIIQCFGVIASLICNLCISVALRAFVEADPCLRCTLHVACLRAIKKKKKKKAKGWNQTGLCQSYSCWLLLLAALVYKSCTIWIKCLQKSTKIYLKKKNNNKKPLFALVCIIMFKRLQKYKDLKKLHLLLLIMSKWISKSTKIYFKKSFERSVGF